MMLNLSKAVQGSQLFQLYFWPWLFWRTDRSLKSMSLPKAEFAHAKIWRTKKEKDTCYTSNMLKWLLKMIAHPFRQRHLHLLFFDFVLVASISVLRGQKIWRIILMQHVNICDSRFFFKLWTHPLAKLMFSGIWLSANSGSRLSRYQSKSMFICLSSFIQVLALNKWINTHIYRYAPDSISEENMWNR